MMGATAVLSRQVVTACGVVQGDAGVSSPVTSVEELGELLSVTLPCVGSVDGGSLLHEVVWCFFLHFLHQNLDWQFDTLRCAKQLKHQLSLLTISSRFWWSVTVSQAHVGCVPLQNTHSGPFFLPAWVTGRSLAST